VDQIAIMRQHAWIGTLILMRSVVRLGACGALHRKHMGQGLALKFTMLM
jgi:hypothetical protein